MSPKLKKILKWVGLFYLAMFVLGLASMTFEHFGKSIVPEQRKAARKSGDVYRRTFDGPFTDSYVGQGDWSAGRKLHFLDSGRAVLEYKAGSDVTVMDLFDYRAQGEAIELTGVERFELHRRYDDMRRDYNTFRRLGRRPADMRVESLRSTRGRDIRAEVEGVAEPVKFHQSTPVSSINKTSELSREGAFVLGLYDGTYADRMPGVWVMERGDYCLLTQYPGADSVGARVVGDQERLLALMKSRDLKGEPFDKADRRVASAKWAARSGGAFNGLWAGAQAAWAFLPLTAIMVILAFFGSCGYSEPDVRGFRMSGMSAFHGFSLAVVVISSALLVWYVASLGGMCMWFMSAELPIPIFNAILTLVFCALLCSMINMEHVELHMLYGLREPRGGWLESLAGYALVGVIAFYVIGSAVASDGMPLPAHWRILGAYLLFVIVTLPRTLLRLRGSDGPRWLLLTFFLLCYPLRYPLFVANIIAGFIHGVGSIKSADPVDSEEPDTMYVTDVYGNTAQIHKLPNGGYMDNNGNAWSGSNGSYHRVGDGTPFSRS